MRRAAEIGDVLYRIATVSMKVTEFELIDTATKGR
jgi:hypothetical protein